MVADRSAVTVHLCSECHVALHGVLSNKQLRAYYHTVERLKEHSALGGIIKRLSKQPFGGPIFAPADRAHGGSPEFPNPFAAYFAEEEGGGPPEKLTRAQRYKRRRAVCFRRQKGRCHYCGRQMTIPEGGRRPRNTDLTLEHLSDKYIQHHSKYSCGGTVAACHACNQQRNRERQKDLPLAELRRRSMREPSGEAHQEGA